MHIKQSSEQLNKYYTPSIEEFYPGFVFEQKVSNTDKDSNLYNSWEKVTVYKDFSTSLNCGTHSSDISYFLDIGYIRVKYLDKEDIESLGFKEWLKDKLPGEVLGHPYGKFTEASSINGTNSEGKSYGATIFYGNTVDSQYIQIEGAIAPGPVYGYIGGKSMFKGIIKNKSELKILLKQLGI